MGHPIRFGLEDALAALLDLAARILPRKGAIRIGETLGAIQFRLDGGRRRRTLDNLRAAYAGEKSEAELADIARRCFRHFGRIGAEAMTFRTLGPRSVGTLIRYEGLEHLREAYGRGKGVLVVSGHFGNWELVALMQGWIGFPLALITRPLDNATLERRLAEIRSLSGNTVVHRQGAVRAMLQSLRRGIGVAIVIDQDAKDTGIFVPFFGRLASTTPTPALVALRTGAPIVPVFAVPRADGGYDICYEPPIPEPNTGDREADVRELTLRMTEALERWVRRYPHLWSWMHRRWRTRPPAGEAAR